MQHAIGSAGWSTQQRALQPQQRHSAPLRSARLGACRRRLAICKATETDAQPKQAWYDKQKEVWMELHNEQEWATVLSSLGSRLLVVDYYAPWCSVCKASYPAMCRIAGDAEFLKGFVFAKASIEHEANKARIKAEGVLGIPYVAVYRQDGSKVTGCPGSFKKVGAVRSNLALIQQHRHELPAAAWPVDPNSHLIPLEQVIKMVAAGRTGSRGNGGAAGSS